MKNIIISIGLLLFSTTLLFAQQKIELDTQFSKLNLSGNLKITLVQSDSLCKTYITVYGVDAQRLKWSSKGDQFSISLPAGIIESESYADLEIHCQQLTTIICEGVTIATRDTIFTHNLTIESRTSINALNMNVCTEDLTIRASGNSNIRLGGSAKWATIDATMGAKVDCSTATFMDCTVRAGQASEVSVRAIEHLDANATAKASVFYFGSPVLKIKTSLGGGVVPVIIPKSESQN